MTPARWEQVKSVLTAALEQSDAARRDAFLATACVDDTSLRREVISLLAQSADDVDECARSVADSHRERHSVTHVGRRIGPYEIVRELGRGGMGTVWLARRADDRFEQHVAIKLLKRGTDTEEVLRRFAAERRILARLEHPNIARLFDAGETDDGLPFFVMEYVGASAHLTTYCKEHQLSVRARLELFRKVCAAVQFAHQNLIVHRDLKPANILVTADAEPKLLDFGIAKLVGQEEHCWDVTSAGRERLTPAYASPEQILGESITTASDIYSLGALLYELLASSPARSFSAAQPTSTELSRVICETDPVRPSVAAPKNVQRALRGDLDNIVLRALARDPARRYVSVDQFSADIRRYLEGLPVRARKDTASYRAVKFIRRHKGAVTAGVLLAIALIAGLAGTAFEARRAERRFREVRGLTNSYLFEIHDAIHDLPGATAARQLIVTRAVEYLDRLAAEARGDRNLQLDLADAYLKVGDVQGKPYTPNLGDSAGALRSYGRAAEIAKPAADAEHGTSSNARRVLSQALESLGGVQSRLKQWKEATQSHERAVAIREQLLRDDPGHAEQWQRGIVANDIGLGDALVNAHRFASDSAAQRTALEFYRAALPLSEALVAAQASTADLFTLAKTCSRIATQLTDLGAANSDPAAYREAATFHQRAIALDEEMLAADPASPKLRRNLADGIIALAYTRGFSGEGLAESLSDCRRAEEIMESLSTADPANAEARQDLSSVYFVTARILQASGEFEAAAESYTRSLRILEPLIAAHPDNVETAFDLGRVRRGLEEVRQHNSEQMH